MEKCKSVKSLAHTKQLTSATPSHGYVGQYQESRLTPNSRWPFEKGQSPSSQFGARLIFDIFDIFDIWESSGDTRRDNVEALYLFCGQARENRGRCRSVDDNDNDDDHGDDSHQVLPKICMAI